jgi:hypothetical protein
MFAKFGVLDEDWEASDAGYAFSSRAHFDNGYLIGFVYFNWAAGSAAFVLGVSWGSFSWTNRTFSPDLFSRFKHSHNINMFLQQ